MSDNVEELGEAPFGYSCPRPTAAEGHQHGSDLVRRLSSIEGRLQAIKQEQRELDVLVDGPLERLAHEVEHLAAVVKRHLMTGEA